MATIYRATVEVNCWKEHTCAGCAGTYAYKFTRTVCGTGPTDEAAAQSAQEIARLALSRWVDAQPCPTCGLYQPEMVANLRASRHWGILLTFACAWALTLCLSVGGLVAQDVAAWVTGLFCLLASLAYLANELRAPNADLDANRRLAQQRIAEGALQAGAAGRTEPVAAEVRSPRWPPGHRLACLALALGTLAAPSAEVLRAVSGWPFNEGWKPPVAGPGEDVLVELPTAPMHCVKGYWRGEPKVVAEDPADPAFAPLTLRATSNRTSWGEQIDLKLREATVKAERPWVRVRLPEKPNLKGRNLKLKIQLDVTYPRPAAGGYENVQETFDHTADLGVASRGAGAKYQSAWWVGVVSGGAAGLLVGAYLIWSAHAIKRRAVPTAAYPVDEGGSKAAE